MARFLVLSLILLDAILILAKADNVASSANPQPPTSSPSSKKVIKQDIAEAPQIRKLGKHRNKAIRSPAAPRLSPSEAPQNMHYPEAAVSSLDHETIQLQDIHIKKEHHHHHHSLEKSVAAAVILGGLASAFLVSVFCYIRATRRKNAEPGPVADVPKV